MYICTYSMLTIYINIPYIHIWFTLEKLTNATVLQMVMVIDELLFYFISPNIKLFIWI